jgi:phage/plasmid primase-like uncharacterized protein
MTHLDAVRTHARGRWLDLLPRLAPHLGEAVARHPQHVPCPVHGGKDGFRLYDDAPETGGGICNTCGAFADGFKLLQWASDWAFRETLDAVADALGITPGATVAPLRRAPAPAHPVTPPQPEPRKVARLRRLRGESSPASSDDPVARYLAGRGVGLDGVAENTILTHPALGCWQGGQIVNQWPAMLALVMGPDGHPVALHATYLDPANPGKKAPVPSPRKLFAAGRGMTRGAAVRLYPMNGDRLAVAEGIETAMAVHALSGLPCWATISAGGLERVVLPTAAREVFICADHDENGTGQRAAERLAERLLAEGRVVRTALPPKPGTDFLDMLQAERGEVTA